MSVEHCAALFVLLIFGHLVADYPLQTDFVAKFKSRKASLDAVPWYYVMAGHSATHAVAVWLITGSVWLGCAEFVAHYFIDIAKCEGWIGIHTDQALHILCKSVWLCVLIVVN